jgi:hypothetical protein
MPWVSDLQHRISLPGFGTEHIINNRILSLQEVHTFSPITVNEARFGYNFIRNDEAPQESIQDSDLEIHRPTASTFPGLPLFSWPATQAGPRSALRRLPWGHVTIRIGGGHSFTAAWPAQHPPRRRVSALPMGCSRNGNATERSISHLQRFSDRDQ